MPQPAATTLSFAPCLTLLALLALVLASCLASSPTSASIDLVSRVAGEPVTAQGPNRSTLDSVFSADGRYLAFVSSASNLSSKDTNGSTRDIFVFDRNTKTLELLTAGADNHSWNPQISADGQIIAFTSTASNLVEADSNGEAPDVFVYDRSTQTTELLTPAANADSFVGSISANGRFVAYWSRATNLVSGDINNVIDVFVYDRTTRSNERLFTGGNGNSFAPSISGDGRFVAFHSDANNLIASDTNGNTDVFVFDRNTHDLEILTPGSASGAVSPSISTDGRFVVFSSFSNNLTTNDTNNFSDIFVYDRNTSYTELLTPGANGPSYTASISPDGTFISFRSRASNLVNDDTNGFYDIFIHNRQTGTKELLTRGANSTSYESSMTADGRLIAMTTFSSNLIAGDINQAADVLVFDRTDESLERIPSIDLSFEVAGGNGESRAPSASENGDFVAFESLAGNLVNGDTNGRRDIFVFNRTSGTTDYLTTNATGDSRAPSISADGRFVVFESDAANLTTGDTNNHTDVFVYDRETVGISLVTPGANNNSTNPAISADGRFITFESTASNLLGADTNGATSDIFVFDRATSTTAILTPGANSDSITPTLSADGRFVAFASEANNLVASDTTTGLFDIFVHDRSANTTHLITTGANSSSFTPTISGDGQFVAFNSIATNLTAVDSNGGIQDIFLHDRTATTTTLITQGANAGSYDPSISSDGRLIAYTSDANNLAPDDNNNNSDVLVFDRDTQVTRLAAAGVDGASSTASISGDGRALAFTSFGLNLANDGTVQFSDVFLVINNESPTANPLSVTTNEDTPISLTVTGTDPELDAITFELVTAPANGALSGSAPNFTYTPNTDYFGTDSFTFSASDSEGLSSPATVSITINPVNDRPAGTGVTEYTTQEDTPLDVTLAGIDTEGDTLQYSISTPPANGRLFGTAPDLIYLPTSNYNGADFFRFTVSDGELTSTPATVNLTVVAINDAPIAVPQALSTTINNSVAFTLEGTDADNDTLTFAVVGFPGNGVLTGTLPNMLYTPASNFVGSDGLSFTVNDGTTTSTSASVSIKVTHAPPPPTTNTQPVAINQTLSTTKETPLEVTLTGSDADGDTLEFNLVALPANGSISGVAPNLVYTPDSNFEGADSLVFSVSDSQDTSELGVVSISVIDTRVKLFSAVLPASRSVEVDATATAFATLINAGTADALACRLQLPSNLDADFFYQTSNSTTNAATGDINTPIDIPAGEAQSFVFGITPEIALQATEVALEFRCTNATDAESFAGLNTLLLSASNAPVPDLIALAATTTANGVMTFENKEGFFTAATINVGSTARISVSADTADTDLGLTLRLCQTDPATSLCINPATPGVEPVLLDVEANGTPTFAVFASAGVPIALDPAKNRVFLRFSDESGVVRGATSVAAGRSD